MKYLDVNIETEQEVLEIRAKCISILKQGGQYYNWSNEGVSVSKGTSIPVGELLQETMEFLRLVNPTDYGYRVRRTSVYYY